MADTNSILQLGIEAARAGNKAEARELFRLVTREDPNNVEGWLWLAGVAEDREEKRTALERVVQLDPGNRLAQKGLDALGRVSVSDSKNRSTEKTAKLEGIDSTNAFIEEVNNAPAKREQPTVSNQLNLALPIFISYRRDDSIDITGRIYDRLVQQFNQDNVFKDVDSIPIGVNFRNFIADRVGQCSILLAVIGRRWLTVKGKNRQRRLDDPRDYVRIEIEVALQRNILVIPLLVSGATMPAEESLPASLQELAYRNAIQIRSDPDFHRDMNRLIKGIEEHVSQER